MSIPDALLKRKGVVSSDRSTHFNINRPAVVLHQRTFFLKGLMNTAFEVGFTGRMCTHAALSKAGPSFHLFQSFHNKHTIMAI